MIFPLMMRKANAVRIPIVPSCSGEPAEPEKIYSSRFVMPASTSRCTG